MKVGIVGSRDCGPVSLDRLTSYIPQNCSLILSGGAQGIDAAAEAAADRLGLPCQIIRPDYQTYGRRAPLVRNTVIADGCDYLLAFWDIHSNGTKQIVSYCIEKGIPFRIVPLSEVTRPGEGVEKGPQPDSSADSCRHE